jgi:hypothetical protein
MIVTACKSASTLSGLHAVDTLWAAVPAFRYQESDDWRLAGEDLRDAIISVMVNDEDLLETVKENFRNTVVHSNLRDPEQLSKLALMADLISAAQRESAGTSRESEGRTLPSERLYRRLSSAGHD